MKYKAIISDMDGTLIKQGQSGAMRGLPSKMVTNAVAKVKNLIHFGVATSRPLAYAKHVFDHLSLSSPSIINGGSIIVDPVTRKILWEKLLEDDATNEIINIIKKQHLIFESHAKEHGKITLVDELNNIHPYNIFISELTDKRAQEIHKELITIPTIAINKTASFTPGLWGFDITHAQATKQHGILQVAEMLNVYPNEIIGVGDGYNDFPLLMACGLKVAMGNAVEDLKAIADYIAPSVEEDGIADVIEKFIL